MNGLVARTPHNSGCRFRILASISPTTTCTLCPSEQSDTSVSVGPACRGATSTMHRSLRRGSGQTHSTGPVQAASIAPGNSGGGEPTALSSTSGFRRERCDGRMSYPSTAVALCMAARTVAHSDCRLPNDKDSSSVQTRPQMREQSLRELPAEAITCSDGKLAF
jgi:hypothetical protein